MAHASYLKAKARELRISRQLTIDELAARLALPRTTIYGWVRDLPFSRPNPAAPWPEGARARGTLAMQAKYRRLREDAYADGCRSFAALAADPTFRDFVCLFLAEGYKRTRHAVSIANSDPAVVRLVNRWTCSLSTGSIDYYLQYHADQDLVALTRFWEGELGLGPGRVRVQRKSNSNQLAKRTWRSEHGVLTVRAHDTQLRARMQGWVDCLRAEWP